MNKVKLTDEILEDWGFKKTKRDEKGIIKKFKIPSLIVKKHKKWNKKQKDKYSKILQKEMERVITNSLEVYYTSGKYIIIMPNNPHR